MDPLSAKDLVLKGSKCWSIGLSDICGRTVCVVSKVIITYSCLDGLSDVGDGLSVKSSLM